VAASLRLGSTTEVMEGFDAEQWLALVERYRVTHCQMVPVMFSRLLRLPEAVRARYDTSSLECIVHAAAPCPEHVRRGMIDWLGPIITEYYGATEAHGATFCDSAQWLAHPGTAGRPVLGELLILDEHGHQCPAGVDGEIWFRGATAFQYFHEPDLTAAGRSADGTASTVGDTGHVDAEVYLYLTDRKTYMIISGGVNIYRRRRRTCCPPTRRCWTSRSSASRTRTWARRSRPSCSWRIRPPPARNSRRS
jgi:long-chain acyl-CoA synthetase